MKVHELRQLQPLQEVYELKKGAKYLILVSRKAGAALQVNEIRRTLQALKGISINACIIVTQESEPFSIFGLDD